MPPKKKSPAPETPPPPAASSGKKSSGNDDGKQARPGSSSGSSGAKGKGSVETAPPGSSGGGSGKGKAAEATPAGAPAPAPQPQIFRSWTGKTPATLLHELCQKSQWMKPDWQTIQRREGFLCNVVLSKQEPRTGTVKQVHFEPPAKRLPNFPPASSSEQPFPYPSPTAQHARHFCAVYALHRINSHMPLHRALPHEIKWYWLELEEAKRLDGPEGAWKYSQDPFNAAPPPKKSAEEIHMEEEKQKKKEQEVAKTTAACSIILSETNRRLVEDLVRKSLAEMETSSSEQTRSEVDNSFKGAWVDDIVSMGFNREMAQEAVQFAGTKEQAFNWLCVHIPEADLPTNFRKTNYNLVNVTGLNVSAAGAKDTASLARSYALDRIVQLGYPRPQAEKAVEACKDSENFEDLALWDLFLRLSGLSRAEINSMKTTSSSSSSCSSHSPTSEELDTLWQDELMALESIYGGRFRVRGDRAKSFIVMLEEDDITADISDESLRSGDAFSGSTSTCLEISCPFGCTYPFTLPIFIIHGGGVSAVAKLSLLRELGMAAREWSSGEPMGFSAVEWLKEHRERILAYPTKLKVLIDSLESNETIDASKLSSKSLSASSSASSPGETPSTASSSSSSSSKSRNRKAASDLARAVPPHASNLTAEVWPTGGSVSEKLKNTQTQIWASSEYASMKSARMSLPAFKARENIISSVHQNRICLLTGATGSGKTTQVGQFLLEDMIESMRGEYCHIICTQPRRISAISVAERVAAERMEKIGRTVGYSVRLESKQSEETRLLMCTTGVLLRRLVSGDSSLDKVSHIIIDEIHERDVDVDFLMAILRDWALTRPRLRIILMSATVEGTKFIEYFSHGGIRPPVIQVSGRTFPVDEFYLEDIVEKIRYAPSLPPQKPPAGGKSPKSPGGDNGSAIDVAEMDLDETKYSQSSIDTIRYLDTVENQIQYELIAKLVAQITLDGIAGGILIFMPGAAEIKHTMSAIDAAVRDGTIRERLTVLPLHSSLSVSEQSRVFASTPGSRKVIISTNVAETSVTIGRVKETQFDSTRNLVSLQETWCSKASVKQRAGRAGRTRHGYAYRLFTRKRWKQFLDQSIPEMLRMPLENLCLQALVMGYDDASLLLGKAIDAPSLESLQTAMGILKRLGAVDAQGKLTAFGRHMASIPTDLRVAKLLVFGAILRCLDPVLTIAACLSSKSPFDIPNEKREEAMAVRRRLDDNKSDLLVDQAAVDGWLRIRHKSPGEELQYRQQHFLSRQSLQSILDLRKQYLNTLVDIGFVTMKNSQEHRKHHAVPEAYNSFASDKRILRAVIAAALYPNVVQIRYPEVIYEKTEHGALPKEVKPKEIRFITETDERVHLHPMSINHSENKFEEPFLAYNDMMKTSKVFLRDSTMVTPFALLLFGGVIEVDHGAQIVALDGWLKFQAPARTAVLVNEIRRQLEAVLDLKFSQPSFDVMSNHIVQAILDLLIYEGR